ncbi:hypothetical protein JMJ35_003053 [Cladonia borealis]|uniref:Uncharacterized protein n=1 Tax=Cladonia borealis TaxID=184061 RepID=A0AA39UCG3_9LECA|nr:hypothetical protein JMJ35_003053 [Cladonia borealis]
MSWPLNYDPTSQSISFEALPKQASRDLSLEDRTIEKDKWSSVSLPASPAAIITTMEKDLVIGNIDHGTSEAKSSTPTERPRSPQSSVEEKPAPIRAYPCPRQAHFSFRLPNKEISSFLKRLLHPKDNILKPAIKLATQVFCLKQNKIEQPEKQPSDVEKVLSKKDVKEWRAMRGYKSLFGQKWVQSVAKAVGKGREEEKDRNAVAL